MSRLTLTFDNGPEPGATESILAALADRELGAIFFVVGERLLDEAGKRQRDECTRPDTGSAITR